MTMSLPLIQNFISLFVYRKKNVDSYKHVHCFILHSRKECKMYIPISYEPIHKFRNEFILHSVYPIRSLMTNASSLSNIVESGRFKQ